MKVLCVGHAAYDITIPIDGFLVENSKNKFFGSIESGGGPACNAAYLLGKWGIDVTYFGTVGNDEYGRKIINELNSVNVDTSFVKILENEPTSACFILANKQNGSRTVVSYKNPNISSDKLEFDVDADILLFDGHEYEVTNQILNKYPNIVSVMDAGSCSSEKLELAKKADYVICSKKFAEEASGMVFNDNESYEKIYNKLKTLISGVIIVTLEEKGCMYEDNGIFEIIPSIKVNSIDTTGAGDIFHGAFVYTLIMGMNISDALLFSNVVAGLSTEYLGVKNSILSLDKVLEVYNEIK